MKKTLTRALSLVLVLAMFVSAVPLVLAVEGPAQTNLTGIDLSIGNNGIIAVPNSSSITVTKVPAEATDALDLEWSSDNESVATVDEDGLVKGVSYGTANITATQKGTQISDTVTVTVKHKPGLSGGATKAMTVGDEAAALPEVVINGLTEETNYTVSWAIKANADSAVELAEGGTKVKALAAGTATLTATITPVAPLTGDNLTSTALDLTVNVSAPQPTPYTATLNPSTLTLTIGEETALPAIEGLTGLEEGTHYSVAWTTEDVEVTIDTTKKTVTATQGTSATLTATITDLDDDDNITISGSPLTCDVTISAPDSVTPSLSDENKKINLPYGTEIDPPALSGMTGLTKDDYTVTWTSGNSNIVKVEGGKFKGLAVGTTILTGKISVSKAGVSLTTNEVTCEVTVSAGVTLEVKDLIELQVDDTYTLKAPTLAGTAASGATLVSWTYTRKTDETANTSLSSDGKTLTALKTGRDTLVLTAVVKVGGHEIPVPPLDVPVSVYWESADIVALMKDNATAFTFADTDVVSKLTLGGDEVDYYIESIAQLLLELNSYHTADRHNNHANYRLYFTSLTADGGVISDTNNQSDLSIKGVSMDALRRCTFTRDANKLAKSKFEYVILDDMNMLIMKGILYIDYAGTSQLQYKTDFTTPVTFKEEDFETFWSDYGTEYALKYITFTDLPYSTTEGVIYTDDSLTTRISTTMKFVTNYGWNTYTYYDVDTVTFKPAANRTQDYKVELPFTAVDEKDNKVNGTVIISVEKGTTSDVSSLGMAFGNSSYKLDDKIAEDFKEAKNEDLDYVTFTLPSVEYGKLYYNFSDLLDSYQIYRTDKFHYEPASSEDVYDLGRVAFIPAAGCSGNVRLNYTATGVNGATYDGFVVLNVKTKTASSYFNDVKSYSWAIDAVDFLRYHGVVNGTNDTNTTFSPGNNITRAHFMLMLYRAFLADDYANFNVTSNFSDITKGTSDYSKELYQAVGVAKYLGISNGSNGKYLPNRYITREEAMTLIYRTLDILDLDLRYTSSNETSDFADYSKVSAYAKDPIKYLIEHGVVLGTGGKINPKSNITRAEMAVILHRVLTY